eukprot:1157461-Pelagomonas_calceolata.AAC.7
MLALLVSNVQMHMLSQNFRQIKPIIAQQTMEFQAQIHFHKLLVSQLGLKEDKGGMLQTRTLDIPLSLIIIDLIAPLYDLTFPSLHGAHTAREVKLVSCCWTTNDMDIF